MDKEVDRIGLQNLGDIRNLLILPLFVDEQKVDPEKGGRAEGGTSIFHKIQGQGPTKPCFHGNCVAVVYLLNKPERYGSNFEPRDVENVMTVRIQP